MIIASFNVNSIRARLPLVIDWLKKVSPDILCIQETKVVDEHFPIQAFRDISYRAVFRGEKSYNGVAIVTKHDVESSSYGFDDRSEATRLISTKIMGITVINTYVPQGFNPLSDKFRFKLDWLSRLYDHIDNFYAPETPLVWVGDINIAPEGDDVYDPEMLDGQVGFHPDERAALERFVDWGFTDVFRLHNKEKGQYTFWDYTVSNAVRKGIGWRIDHIMATQVLADKSIRAWIDVEPRLLPRPSDHTPVIADFAI